MMKMIRHSTCFGIALALTISVAQAGEVTVKGVHLCCGACVRDVGKALTSVDGVSAAACNRDLKIVTFQAANAKAASAGIVALAKAGFHGSATHGEKAVAFPSSGAKKGAKADSVTLTGVHLCCGGCVNAAKKILEKVDGVTAIEVDRTGRTIKASGSEINILALVKAVNKGGFHGTLSK